MIDTSTETLTISIEPDRVVFSGLVDVHRFDQPDCADIAAYVRSLAPEHVHIVAGHEDTSQLENLLRDDAISVTSETPHERETHPPTEEWGEISLRRPAERSRKPGFLLLAVVVVVLLFCAAAIWVVTVRGEETSISATSSTPTPPAASPPPSFAPPETSRAPDQAPEPPGTVLLEQDGLSVELPVGFRLEPDEDMWRASGPDPDFRLQLAVDPLYGVPHDALLDQVEREIAEDDELHLLGREDLEIRYHHVLEDGSEAHWATWVDGDHQISLGCHTRSAPTAVQKTTCSMANESARFSPR